MSQDTGQLAPGLEQTFSQTRVGLSSSMAACDVRQGQAEVFLRENGAAASGGAQVLAEQKTGG